jgi:hypothetical protein
MTNTPKYETIQEPFTIFNFPFERLRLDPYYTNATSSIQKSQYGDIHISTLIYDSSKEKFYKYSVNLTDGLKVKQLFAPSISYYIGKDKPQTDDPQFYIHPILHPRYSESINGKIQKTETQSGKYIEAFLDKIKDRVEQLLNELKPNIKILILGKNKDKTEDLIKPVYSHPDDQNEQPNTDLSKKFLVKLWLVNHNKQDSNENNKSALKIPDTNMSILTKIYDCTSSRKTSKPVPPMSDYMKQLRKFVYQKKYHENSTTDRCNTTFKLEVMGFTVHGKPGQPTPYDIQITAKSITYCSIQKLDKNFPLNMSVINQIENERQEINEEYGIINDADSDDDSNEVTGIENYNNSTYSQFTKINNTQQYPDSPNTQKQQDNNHNNEEYHDDLNALKEIENELCDNDMDIQFNDKKRKKSPVDINKTLKKQKIGK